MSYHQAPPSSEDTQVVMLVVIAGALLGVLAAVL
jgi:hypothetical protein